MLKAAELVSMQTLAKSALPETAVIELASVVSDGGGGETTTWLENQAVPCRLMSSTATEAEEGGRIAADADWILTLPAGTVVTTDARIITHGMTLSVESVSNRSWEITKQVACNGVV